MPTIQEEEEPEKSKSRRKSNSPKKVIFEYFNINLTNESLNLPFLITVTLPFSDIRQAGTSQANQESRDEKGEVATSK